MRIITRVILLAFLAVTFSCPVMAQTDYCQVLTGWVDQQTHISTSLFNVGHYCIDPDTDDSPFNRTFIHTESGIKVTAGVDYYTRYPEKNILRMRMGMRLGNQKEDQDGGSTRLDVFFSVNSVYAETIRDKHWKVLTISKSIIKDGKEYSFLFECFKQTKQSRKIFRCSK